MSRFRADHLTSIAKFMRSFDPEAQPTDFIPTTQDIRTVFKRLNEVVWKDSLPEPEFQVKRQRGAWAMCEGDDKKTIITTTDRFPNQHLFVVVVAHEMVHHCQWVRLGKMDHGKSFYEWRPALARYLIPLQHQSGRGNKIDWYHSRNFDWSKINPAWYDPA